MIHAESKVVRVGSRESVLAVKQAEIVMNAVKRHNPCIEFQLVKISTKADRLQERSLDSIGGKGLFIKELEHSLMNHEIDIAVHSYKDVPCEETDDLPIVALSEREFPFDALILHKAENGFSSPLESMLIPQDIPVGSSSLRRSLQFKDIYNNLEIAPIRGNVITRLGKLDAGNYCALILAQAGLHRLGLADRITKVFSPDEMIPAASQGIIAVQGRKGEDYSWLACFHSKKSETASKAERQFLRTLEGGCHSPAAVYCKIHGRELFLTGMYADKCGHMVKDSSSGDIDEAALIGEQLANDLRNKVVNGW